MLKREPYIDIVIGPQSYHKISDLIKNFTTEKKDEITEELSTTLKGDVVIRDAGTFKHTYDKSGKSTVSAIYFEFKNNRGSIKVQCYDWDDNMPYSDILMVTIDTEEYRNFLKYEAY